jgi:hypothetical protein
MGGKELGQEQEQEGHHRKPGIRAEGPAAKLTPLLSQPIWSPCELEGIRSRNPVSHHLHVTVDTVSPERDCKGRGYGYQ